MTRILTALMLTLAFTACGSEEVGRLEGLDYGTKLDILLCQKAQSHGIAVEEWPSVKFLVEDLCFAQNTERSDYLDWNCGPMKRETPGFIRCYRKDSPCWKHTGTSPEGHPSLCTDR